MRGANLFSMLFNTQCTEQILTEAVSSDFHLGVSKANVSSTHCVSKFWAPRLNVEPMVVKKKEKKKRGAAHLFCHTGTAHSDGNIPTSLPPSQQSVPAIPAPAG